MIYANDKISFLYGLDKKDGEIGLELEVEGRGLPLNIDNTTWRVEHDGSLRYGGVEYIYHNPLKLEKVKESLEKWNEVVSDNRAVVYETDRTSVHTHMNVQDYSIKDVVTACVSYYILENVLMKYAGPSRETNLFCLPLKQSKNQISALKLLSEGALPPTNRFKYSAMNLTALAKYGSLEQRAMRGYYDPDFLDEWVTNLYNIIKKAPKYFNSPTEAFDFFYGRDFKDYLGVYFTGSFIDKLTSIKDWDLDKNSNMSCLGDFVYNWDHTTKRPFKDKLKKKKKVSNQIQNFTSDERMRRHAAEMARYEQARQQFNTGTWATTPPEFTRTLERIRARTTPTTNRDTIRELTPLPNSPTEGWIVDEVIDIEDDTDF